MRDLRIFYASDFHGSDLCFRKFINAGKTFEADALIFGGDLAGKSLVPVVESDGEFLVYTHIGKPTIANQAELLEIARALRARGAYLATVSGSDAERFGSNELEQQRMLRESVVIEAQKWLERAKEVLMPLGIECYIMAGNDDHPEVAALLDEADFVVCHDDRVVYVREEIPLVGLGWSNPTPFNSPRELPEADMETRLSVLFDQLSSPNHIILNAHCPPYGSGLDFAPEISAELKVISHGGQPRMIPVGSTAVLKIIKRYQPLLGLHGHCHESRHRCSIGATTCINPGSLYSEGTLSGAVLDISAGKIKNAQFING